MEELQRPGSPRSMADRLRAWIDWFGYGRIIGSAIATVVVCAGAYWLVRVPPPPTEASLPLASTSVAPATVGSSPGGGTATTDGSVPSGTGPPTIVAVHVAGAVVTAGVYQLPDGSRVESAIEAAGGAMPDADPNALNLAAPLVDGSRIYVPRIGEEVLASIEVAGPAVPVDGVSAIVDVNRATVAELDALPGIGPATAQAIVAEREGNGPFVSVDDLDRVAGIGPAKVEALRELVTT